MIGRSLAGGRFEVTERIAGKAWWGFYRALEVPLGGRCLVTTSTAPRDRERDAFEAAVAFNAPGVAALLYHGSVSEAEHPHYAVVEREPSGRSLADWARGPVAGTTALAIIAALARTVQAVQQRDNQPLGGLHPRTIYVDDGRFTGCAPRFCRLHEWAATEFKRPLLDPSFEPREVLLGARRYVASDVFSLCAVLAWLTTHIAPFGKTVFEEIANVERRSEPQGELSAAWGETVRRGLRHDFDARPSIAELIDALGS